MSRPYCCALGTVGGGERAFINKDSATQLADVPQIPIGNVPENNVRRRGQEC